METGYLSYFYSFYSEPTIYCFLLLALLKFALLYCSPQKVSAVDIVIFSLFFIMFNAAKLQTAVYVPVFLFALLALFLICRKPTINRRYLAAVMTFFFLLNALICAVFSVRTPTSAKNANVFNSVFVGVLKNEENPIEILGELGLNKSLAVYQNQDYYQSGGAADVTSDYYKSELFDKLSLHDIIKYYLRHMDRLYAKVREVSFISGNNIPEISKNLERVSGDNNPHHTTFMVIWNTVRQRVLQRDFSLILIFICLILALSIYRAIKNKTAGLLGLIIAFCCFGILSQLPIKIIGDGIREGESVKHLFLYNLSWDILIYSILFALIVSLNRYRDAFREHR
jgi:hypothetical protein